MEIKGKVIQVLPIESGTSKAGKEWKKASLVLETPGQYPKKVKISNMKSPDEFAKLPIGTEATFHVEVESREFNGRWYTEVSCWKWETENAPQAAPQSATPNLDSLGVQGYQNKPNTPLPTAAGGDDLPF